MRFLNRRIGALTARNNADSPHHGSALLLALGLVIVVGCADSETNQTVPPADSSSHDTIQATAGGAWTDERIHRELARTNPGYNNQAAFRLENGQIIALQLTGAGVTNLTAIQDMKLQALDARQCRIKDLTALQGLPLLELYLEETDVTDLTPLQGMPLQKLYLSMTPVRDLQPLAGAPIVELNLVNTQVTDLTPLRGMPLKMLWLNETPVRDIAPLAGCPLVSLTLHRTLVDDLSPLTGSSLQRLHIAETPVTDLTPLKGLRLTRLVFNPERIQTGLEVARQMTTLRQIGTVLEEVMPPQIFWATQDGSQPQ